MKELEHLFKSDDLLISEQSMVEFVHQQTMYFNMSLFHSSLNKLSYEVHIILLYLIYVIAYVNWK